MAELDEAAIRARLEAATPGPWIHLEVQDGDECGPLPELRPTEGWSTPEAAAEDVWFNADTAADAEFIAHARTDVERLLDVVADLRSRVACVLEASYWDRPYDERIAAIRGMCDLETNGLTSTNDGESTIADVLARAEAAEGAVDRVRRRHPRGDEETGPLAPGLWCPTCGRERSENGYGACPDRAALATPTTTKGGEG